MQSTHHILTALSKQKEQLEHDFAVRNRLSRNYISPVDASTVVQTNVPSSGEWSVSQQTQKPGERAQHLQQLLHILRQQLHQLSEGTENLSALQQVVLLSCPLGGTELSSF